MAYNPNCVFCGTGDTFPSPVLVAVKDYTDWANIAYAASSAVAYVGQIVSVTDPPGVYMVLADRTLLTLFDAVTTTLSANLYPKFDNRPKFGENLKKNRPVFVEKPPYEGKKAALGVFGDRFFLKRRCSEEKFF
jgi:hypothetical protein